MAGFVKCLKKKWWWENETIFTESVTQWKVEANPCFISNCEINMLDIHYGGV